MMSTVRVPQIGAKTINRNRRTQRVKQQGIPKEFQSSLKTISNSTKINSTNSQALQRKIIRIKYKKVGSNCPIKGLVMSVEWEQININSSQMPQVLCTLTQIQS